MSADLKDHGWQGGHSRAPQSAPQPNVVQEFLQEYEQATIKHYTALTAIIEGICKSLLEPAEILCQVSSRTKDPTKLAPKATRVAEMAEAEVREASEEIAEASAKKHDTLSEGVKINSPSAATDRNSLKGKGRAKEGLSKADLYQKIADLSGIRLLVYWPDDAAEVVKLINESGLLKTEEAIVSFTRSRVDYRKQDERIQKHGGDLNLTDGPWRSEHLSMENNNIQRWKHSGYRAVHLHVTLKDQVEGFWDAPKNQTSKGESTLHPTSDWKELKDRFSAITFRDLKGKKAEIQIATIVMHAWSQVEHDIIYKNPFGIPINATMTRMLDGVNGLSITSDILMQELRRMVDHWNEVKDTPFRDVVEFRNWLFETYVKEREDSWEVDMRWARLANEVLQNHPFQSRPFTRDKVRKLIKECDIMNIPRRGLEKLDLCALLLEAAGSRKPEEPEWRMHMESDESKSQALLYKLLVVANASSILVLLGGLSAYKQILQRYDIQMLIRINWIVLGFESMTKMEEHRGALDDFSNLFLTERWSNAHDVAVALARLSYFAFGPSHDSGMRFYYARDSPLDASLRAICQDFHPIFFNYMSAFVRSPFNYAEDGKALHHRLASKREPYLLLPKPSDAGHALWISTGDETYETYNRPLIVVDLSHENYKWLGNQQLWHHEEATVLKFLQHRAQNRGPWWSEYIQAQSAEGQRTGLSPNSTSLRPDEISQMSYQKGEDSEGTTRQQTEDA